MTRTPGSRPLLPADVNAQERAAHAVRLRIAGLTEAEIARQVGLSQSRVSRIIKSALAAQRSQTGDDLRSLEVERTEALHRAVWPKALRGDVGAAGVVLKAGDRRARLLGLDEGGDGAPGAHLIVSVWLECFVLDSQEAMDALLDEARRLGLQAAQTLGPAATVDAVKTRMYWLHIPKNPRADETPTQDYANMLAAIKAGESLGV